jgi:hypothetical protein
MAGLGGFIAPPLGYVLIVGTGQATAQALLKLGEGSAGVTAGYGGLTLEPRPKDVALVTWEGGEPTQVTIPFTIGSKRRPNGRETERTARALEKLAGQGGKYRPPAVIVDAAGAVPHDYTQARHVRWRVEDLTWDLDAESRGGAGRRVWCVGSLVLRQDVTDSSLAGLTPAISRNRDQREGELRGNRYVAKQGDTLRTIAKRLELTRAEVGDMKALNKIRDASAKLKTGRVVYLPKRSAKFG